MKGLKKLGKLGNFINQAGLTVEQTRRCHFKVYRGDRFLIQISGTPSDYRSRLNELARLKRKLATELAH